MLQRTSVVRHKSLDICCHSDPTHAGEEFRFNDEINVYQM